MNRKTEGSESAAAGQVARVEALCRRYLTAMESGDLEALLSLFTDDATATSPISGKQPARGGRVEEVNNHIIVQGDMAVVQTVQKAVVNNARGPGVEQEARETSVLRREESGWKIVAHHADVLPNWIEIAGTARTA